MQTTSLRSHAISLAIFALAALVAACSHTLPVEPDGGNGSGNGGTGAKPLFAEKRGAFPEPAIRDPIVAIRRSTARYHNLSAALKDGFTFLHPCEVRQDGNVGVVYINLERLLDGKVDPEHPDGLIYETDRNGKLTLAAAEFAVPNSGQAAPQFLDHSFQREDEFGVFGLHVWLWQANPNGLFAEGNPNVSCADSGGES